jgi:hypothetical protein
MSTLTVPTSLGGTGTTYRSDDGANGMASDGGYGYTSQDLLFEMLGEVITANQTAVTASAGATNAANVNGTSTSSVAVGTGSKSFTYVEANRTVVVGMYLQVASAADPANFMNGPVTAWDSGTKVVTILVPTAGTGGSGTHADWVISLSGIPGVSGGVTLTGTETLTNKTLTSPRIGTSILDTGGNELFLLTATASAVNELTYANAATSNNPSFTASGGDTNIGINLVPKGTGKVQAAGVEVATISGTQTLTNKTITSPTITGGTVDTFNIGYKEIPQNSQSAAYTLVLSDSGKHIYHPAADTTARVWTIPANASVAFPIGTAVTFDNDFGAGAITIAITSDTLVLVGAAGSTGSRTLASGGQATAVKVTSTRWRINGTGLT